MQIDSDNTDYQNNDTTQGKHKRKKGFELNAATVTIAVVAAALIACGGYYGVKYFKNSDEAAELKEDNLNSYKAMNNVELRASASPSANVIAVLKADSIVAGKSVGKVGGVEWLEITAADGTHGFLPASSLVQIGTDVNLANVKNENINIITTTAVNLRAIPTLTGQIVGTVDGGTKLTADGTIMSQGEQWYRFHFNGTTAFMMARFASIEEQAAIQNANISKLGVVGIVNNITNLQATPFAESRIIKPLLINEEVAIIGQTKSDDWWYIVRQTDGTQGFVLKNAITIPASENKWLYSDGTIAPGPDIPKGRVAKPAAVAESAASEPQDVKVDMGATPPVANPEHKSDSAKTEAVKPEVKKPETKKTEHNNAVNTKAVPPR